MSAIRKEEINPAVPCKERVLVLLDKGGKNWYVRIRAFGRYRFVSLGTPDLMEARRKAFLEPPEPNEKYSYSIKKALREFQESRQQLMDSPSANKNIRLNTFKAYKARIASLDKFFEYQQAANKDKRIKTVGSLVGKDFKGYEFWRAKQGIMLTTIKTELSQVNTILAWFYDNSYMPNKIKLKLPSVDISKYRIPNRLLTLEEHQTMVSVLKTYCTTGDADAQEKWKLYRLWLEWLEETFTRPHEVRMLRFTDVKEQMIDGKTTVQFYTKAESKTGIRLVYATSRGKTRLLKLYESWGLAISPQTPLFVFPTGKPPSSSWLGEQWGKLIEKCGFDVEPRELTQYSLRSQGINELLVQGVAPTKVADLAGHSLTMQQSIYKKYRLEDDHSVLRDDKKKPQKKRNLMTTDADLPYPWEVDPRTGEWFPDDDE